MAAVGSAVGLGNIWRFPYMCYEHGGGAFFIPFFIAIFTLGIPLMILEFTLGHWSRGGAPKAFAKIGRKWEWLGWWPLLVEFITVIYYSVIMAWCFNYMIFSLDLKWGADAEGFFNNSFLGMTLPGAMEGISYYLTPDFSKLWNARIWLAAYSQVLWSFSLAGGIMITYASYLPKKSDINNNAIITCLVDAGVSFFAGFAVFSVIGYLAYSSGVGVTEVVKVGPELAFIAYPTAVMLLPFAAAFFGIIFFIALLNFGIDSAFSMVEPLPVGINEKWRISKEKATAIVCIVGFLAGLIYTTGSGIHWLSITDYFIANFGLALIALFECIIVGYMYNLSKLRKHANDVSEIKIGVWWDILIKYVNPVILITLFILVIYENITTRYEGYSTFALLIGGVLIAVLAFVLSFVFMKIRGDK